MGVPLQQVEQHVKYVYIPGLFYLLSDLKGLQRMCPDEYPYNLLCHLVLQLMLISWNWTWFFGDSKTSEWMPQEKQIEFVKVTGEGKTSAIFKGQCRLISHERRPKYTILIKCTLLGIQLAKNVILSMSVFNMTKKM